MGVIDIGFRVVVGVEVGLVTFCSMFGIQKFILLRNTLHIISDKLLYSEHDAESNQSYFDYDNDSKEDVDYIHFVLLTGV